MRMGRGAFFPQHVLPRRVLRSAVFVVGSVAIVVEGCIAASQGDQRRIGPRGLIEALPTPYFVCAGLLTLLFFVELFRFRRSGAGNVVLTTILVGMVVLLHGAPGFLEQEPRFATAWLHAGFTGQILDHGVSAPGVDARFNWPGFFGAAAAVTGAGGLTSAVPLLRWAPVVMVLLYLPPVYVIGKQVTASGTATWLGLWLFLLVNWVGQDYFAPQSIGFVLYLLCLAILVTFFRSGRRLWPHRSTGAQERVPEGLPDVPAGPRLRAALIVLLVLLVAALAMTHQLSPIMLVAASAALVLAGRLRLIAFPVIAGVLTLGWISVGVTAYWVGHLQIIFGGIGHVDAVVNTSVGERLTGSVAHLSLVRTRLEYTGVVWALIGLCTVLLWTMRRTPVTLVALVVAPFVTLVQNYGSEGVLRIFLFSAPFGCLIIAQFLVLVARVRPMQVLVAGVSIALIPLFVLTRYGNESFEQVRPLEVEAIQELYTIAPPGSNLVSPTSQLPWRFDHATDYDYSRPTDARGFLRGHLDAIRGLVSREPPPGARTYLVVTTSQRIYAARAFRGNRHWFRKVQPLLTAANGYHLVYRNSDAVIYEFEAS
jgi:hypothetical protein